MPDASGYYSGVEHDQFWAGFEFAGKVFEDKFFGGPTKDMVRGWLQEARYGHERSSSEQET
jgi:hypothetical protein